MDDQNQTAPSDAPTNDAQPVNSGTGTIFSPATADASVNPYDLTQPQGVSPNIGTPPPVFAQPSMPAEPKPAPGVDSAPPPAGSSAPGKAASPTQPPAPAPADGDLMAIKKAALDNLTPLVDDLQLTPEDKFKTMMMLIQASDNSQLIKKAYGAASSIRDEKARAQALLDVVNEINYFTQAKSQNNQTPPPTVN